MSQSSSVLAEPLPHVVLGPTSPFCDGWGRVCKAKYDVELIDDQNGRVIRRLCRAHFIHLKAVVTQSRLNDPAKYHN